MHWEGFMTAKTCWKFEVATMKKRGENGEWKFVEKKNNKKKKETLRKQKGLPMKSEDLKYLRYFSIDFAQIFSIVIEWQ